MRLRTQERAEQDAFANERGVTNHFHRRKSDCMQLREFFYERGSGGGLGDVNSAEVSGCFCATGPKSEFPLPN